MKTQGWLVEDAPAVLRAWFREEKEAREFAAAHGGLVVRRMDGAVQAAPQSAGVSL